MTDVRRRTGRALAAVLLVLAMLLALTGGTLLSGRPAPNNLTANAAVTIKTQAAADRIGGIRGIDVSKYQGTINWKKVAQDNVKFVFIRACYGTTTDPKFLTNARGAAEAGLDVGAYHYATFTDRNSMRKEAKHLIQVLSKVNLTYPVALDLEDSRHAKMSKSTLTALAVEFMELIKAEGYDVMLYSNTNFIKNHLNTTTLKDYNLWIANYLEEPKSQNPTVWQHTSYGTVSGISGRVDIDIAYKDLSRNDRLSCKSDANFDTYDIIPDETTLYSIAANLNERYGFLLPGKPPSDKLMTGILRGLQQEVNVQWGVNYQVSNTLSQQQLSTLQSVNFTSATHGNITYLIQARLFMLGWYTESPSSWFDEDTVYALQQFQWFNGLEPTGEMTPETLQALLQ